MPHRPRFLAPLLITIATLLAVGTTVIAADGEGSQDVQVAMSAAPTSYDPPAAQDPWVAVRDALAARTWYAAVVEQNAAKAKAVHRPARHQGSTTHHASGSTAECIGQVENGGDYGRSSNPTHFGKYQYDRQTWVAHGGDPSTWGTASPEEQERVFAEGTAKYGYGAWTPYDSC